MSSLENRLAEGYRVSDVAWRRLDESRFGSCMAVLPNGRAFAVPAVYYLLTRILQETNHLPEIRSRMQEAFGDPIDDPTIERAIERLIEKEIVLPPDSPDTQRPSASLEYVPPFRLLFHFHHVAVLEAILTALRPAIVIPIVLLSLVTWSSHFSLLMDNVFRSGLLSMTLSSDPHNAFVYFATLPLLMICHEAGHGIAARAFKVPIDSFGFGIYFIFPVFFCSTNGAWLLRSRRERILINMGGIIAEWTIGGLLFWAMLQYSPSDWGSGPVFFFSLALLTRTLWTLNPFLRNDGYWVVSDLLNQHNLRRRALRLALSTMTGKISIREITGHSRLLLLFGCCCIAFTNLMMLLSAFWLKHWIQQATGLPTWVALSLASALILIPFFILKKNAAASKGL